MKPRAPLTRPIHVSKIKITMNRKPWWRRMIDRFQARMDKKTPDEQFTEHADAVSRAFRTELSGLLAAALFAKKTLDISRQVETPFPDAIFSGEKPIDDAARAELVEYLKAIEEFQYELIDRDTPVTLAAAKGMTTWIVSLHAITQPGMMERGREMWAKLIAGAEGLEESHKFMLRREPSDVERTYFSYRPGLFLN